MVQIYYNVIQLENSPLSFSAEKNTIKKGRVNTVVVDNRKDDPNRYAVRERAGTKYIRDGNPQPKNGKVIGHIFDGAYAMSVT